MLITIPYNGRLAKIEIILESNNINKKKTTLIIFCNNYVSIIYQCILITKTIIKIINCMIYS